MNGYVGCTTAIRERLAHMTRRLYRKLSESGQACNSGQKNYDSRKIWWRAPLRRLGNDPVVVDGNSVCELHGKVAGR